MFEKVKKFYILGLYSKEQVRKFVEKGHLTSTDYFMITGEPYFSYD